MSMCYREAEKLLIIHDFYKKELVFLHLNIVSFKETGINPPSLYGNRIKMNKGQDNLLALKEDSILQIFLEVSKDGYDEIITIGERKNRDIESFAPLGHNRVILGVEGGEISVYQYSRLSTGSNQSNSELIYKTELNRPMFEISRFGDQGSIGSKFGCISVNETLDEVLVSTFQKDRCSQKDLFLLGINDFGALKVLNTKKIDSGEVDSGYGFLDINHSIYNRTLLFASQMKTGKECHVYYVDENKDIKSLFSFEINPEGFSCAAISHGIKYYTLSSKGKLQIYPLGFHKYALPNINFSDFNTKISDSMLSGYQRSSWKKRNSNLTVSSRGKYKNKGIFMSEDIENNSNISRVNKKNRYKNNFVNKINPSPKNDSKPLQEISNNRRNIESVSRSQVDHPFSFSSNNSIQSDPNSRNSYTKENIPMDMNRMSRYKNSNLSKRDHMKYQSRNGRRMTFGVNEAITDFSQNLDSYESKPSWNLNYYDSKIDLGKENKVNQIF